MRHHGRDLLNIEVKLIYALQKSLSMGANSKSLLSCNNSLDGENGGLTSSQSMSVHVSTSTVPIARSSAVSLVWQSTSVSGRLFSSAQLNVLLVIISVSSSTLHRPFHPSYTFYHDSAYISQGCNYFLAWSSRFVFDDSVFGLKEYFTMLVSSKVLLILFFRIRNSIVSHNFSRYSFLCSTHICLFILLLYRYLPS